MTASTRRRALVLAGAMVSVSGLALWARPVRRTPDAADLLDLDAAVPSRFGDWQTDPASVAFVRAAQAQARRTKIYDQLLERTFMNSAGAQIMLSIAYGNEQSARMQLHRPEICYRAGGFQIRNLHPVSLELAGARLPATRLRADMPGRPEPITYWTVLGGEVMADSDSFRWRRLRFAAKGELLEGILVRVSSIDPDDTRAFSLQEQFARQFADALAPAARRHLIGTPERG